MIPNAGDQLAVTIEDGRLVITIGIGLLAWAVQSAEPQWPEDFAVVDVEGFAKAIAKELKRDEEDGTTPVHRMLDAAATEVLESGDEAVDEGPVEAGLKLAEAAMGQPQAPLRVREAEE